MSRNLMRQTADQDSFCSQQKVDMVKKRNDARKRISSLLSLDMGLDRDEETFFSDQSLNSIELMETLEESKGMEKYRKEISRRVRECNQLARENVSLKMQVLKLQREHRLLNKGNHNAAARLRLLLGKITKLERQLAQFKSANGTFREVTLHPKVVSEYSEKHSGKIRSARELEASALDSSGNVLSTNLTKKVTVKETSELEQVSADTKLLTKKLRRAPVARTRQSSRRGQSRAQSSETEDFPQRVEVRCLHESPSVIGIRSPTLRSRLSRVCQNPDENEHWEPRPIVGADRGVVEYSSSELLHKEKKALERERELLLLDRLRLEKERRQIQLQRRKCEIVDAQTASVKQGRPYASSTTRYSFSDGSPYYCSVHYGNTCDEFTSHGNLAGGLRRSPDPSSDFNEGSNMNRLHGSHLDHYYCIESPSSCCYDFRATYAKRETPLFGTSRSAYSLPPVKVRASKKYSYRRSNTMLLDYMDRGDSQYQAKRHDGWDGILLSRQRQHYQYESFGQSEHNTEQPLYCQSGDGGSQTTRESGGPTTRHNEEKMARKNKNKKKRKGRRRSGQSGKCDIRSTERNSLLDENAPNVTILELDSKLASLQRHVHAIRQIVNDVSSKNKKTYALRRHLGYVMSFHEKLKKVTGSSRRIVRGILKRQERELRRCRNDVFLDSNGIQCHPCQEVEQQNQPHFHYFTLSDLEHSAVSRPEYSDSRSSSVQTMSTGFEGNLPWNNKNSQYKK